MSFLPIDCTRFPIASIAEHIELLQLNGSDAPAEFPQLPAGFLPFEEFESAFSLEATSTEQLHPVTKELSQTMHRNVIDGLELLVQADEMVLHGLELCIPFIEAHADLLADKLRHGGKIVFVGSGSSGRVAIDIAAKCSIAFPEAQHQIWGMVAGGDAAFIREKEGFEDSEADGKKAVDHAHLGSEDTVILISASGSSSFNVGCGEASAEKGATVLYFYNSINIPARTQRLFDRPNNPVIPFCVDIGPQALSGSTRLQAATLAEAGLGAFVVSALYLKQGKEQVSKQYPQLLAGKMREGIALIRQNLKEIAAFIFEERAVFSDKKANFRQLRDMTEQGYVTFLASEESLREVLIDTTETSPTFSTNPIRRQGESQKRRAEFQAYVVGKKDNAEAWHALLGRAIPVEETKDANSFLLGADVDGFDSYQQRPKGTGNFVIGVAKTSDAHKGLQPLVEALEGVKASGGRTGLLWLSRGTLPDELRHCSDAVVAIGEVPYDSVGFVETIILKQILNLISNGTMTLMNKVHGNRMIDVRPSNNKLRDRCIRLIKGIWSEYLPPLTCSNKELYAYVTHVSVIKDAYEQRGVYTPSVIKITLAMLAMNIGLKDFDDAVTTLAACGESIDQLFQCHEAR